MSLALNFKVDADSGQEVTFSTFATSMFSGVVDSNSQYYVHSSEAVFTNPEPEATATSHKRRAKNATAAVLRPNLSKQGRVSQTTENP
jgi:imidazoleglycerol phosphate synthase glutamine amidotransferase subunit HisH